MDTHLLIKIVHMTGASLACLAVFVRAFTLFKGVQGNMPNPAMRTLFVALQHGAMTLIALTGIVLLWMKNFDAEPWFYAKVILFLVLLSSLGKAYRKDDSMLLVQRRAGLFIAAGSLAAIIVLIMLKPNFG
ncbi:SirB2 family protein [Acinetobacter tianfuensis]|uniref:Invasion protein expression up-regulator SirB n=1 Tax=Acinetobacter tianfuensis TaxID=2419603 RepID=A0A3A8EJ01_9GAMM|nr:SirB2 family protein [Acinetobacter tianfuensis]RKG30720.1 invasion protein expression up-regulator SirB [Acinetobacter tianfuensis]